ncbi:MAG: hypothetical protein AVDCRST_MAG95-286 [uncultured Adhaeribacter sp.]|uniref:Uncharacterized protein n=1 Tax=uncultured Adhaeribacter sp. TaxID=448109 RepID=A0A6J4H9A3_9BACT|nr:MAG: hypothetical protein AVDCRST_MAG95-286 [uncultured Adhaeribacter sp.]
MILSATNPMIGLNQNKSVYFRSVIINKPGGLQNSPGLFL